MLLIVLFLGLNIVWAEGSVVWLKGKPDPKLTPGLSTIPLEDLGSIVTFSDEASNAINNLKVELEAVKPLLLEFDGELLIMSRLDAAISDVHILQNEEEARILYEALVFQGFAIHRYFQKTLATDPTAKPYRITLSSKIEILPWVNAVAIDPTRKPDKALISEAPDLAAFDALRARMLSTPLATIEIPTLDDDLSLTINGKEITATRIRVYTGKHRIAIWKEIGNSLRYQTVIQLQSGKQKKITLPASAKDFIDLHLPMRKATPRIALSNAQKIALSSLPAPVHVAIRGNRKGTLYALQGNALVLVQRLNRTASEEQRILLRAGGGMGWFSDGDWLLQNHQNGAEPNLSTVNAATPSAYLAMSLETQFFTTGAGVDLSLPLGDFHSLPVGENSTLRLRTYPHLHAGVPWLQATVGYLFPWQIGLGARAHKNLISNVELTGAYVYGIGIPIPRPQKRPAFLPQNVQSAWLGLTIPFQISP